MIKPEKSPKIREKKIIKFLQKTLNFLEIPQKTQKC